ncbi:hypothetical protein DLH72_02455 [Candidatus Gracilibacteria bacterium]|nr:MAG: hypothetical protein DLH72_02455 [Candidatus Gracilibacteria bacterium]
MLLLQDFLSLLYNFVKLYKKFSFFLFLKNIFKLLKFYGKIGKNQEKAKNKKILLFVINIL